ncbi:right-handed parallel beta-helix repeat-containing protein [Halorubrum depositum]|uniref:right-handed parallel beta-helix repeat-containing protein n=1 Tax=Halorubrum depositum TaxID=2583992 RepID=UPI0011A3F5F2|nr:right-handed parallel beta-helix repeat-containing protein [Halorubrum depositum]
MVAGTVVGLSSISTTAAAPTEVDRCASLTEPGEYVLTADLDAEGDCLTLGPGVTLDGNGHAISGDGSGIGLSFDLGRDESAAVRDLRITNFGAGTSVGSPGGEIALEAVSVTDSSVGIRGGPKGRIAVRDSVVSDNGVGVGPGEGTRLSITESTLSGNSDAAVSTDLGHVTELRRSTVRENGAGVATGEGTFVDNTVADNDGFGLRLIGLVAPTDLGSATVVGNDIRNNAGPGIEFASSGGDVRGNAIVGNRTGILLSGVADGFGDSVPEYAFTGNDIAGNDEFGVRNASEQTAVASCNYWGDPTGPAAEETPAEAPKGDEVDGGVEFVPWSVEPVRGGDPVCFGGQAIGDFESQPTDPDGDGRYEDVDGDGDVDADDVEAMFANRDDELVRSHPDAFDFNGDGDVDALDVRALFNEVLDR